MGSFWLFWPGFIPPGPPPGFMPPPLADLSPLLDLQRELRIRKFVMEEWLAVASS